MDESKWAQVGRFLTVGGTLLGVIIAGLTIYDRTGGPGVMGTVEYKQCGIPPQASKELNQSVDIKVLSELIGKSKSNKESADKTLAAVEAEISPASQQLRTSLRSLQNLLSNNVVKFVIRNDSRAVAHDVKLLIPGKGTAEISEPTTISTEGRQVEWTDTLPIGDVRPGGVVAVNAWLVKGFMVSSELLKPALLHAGGTGTLYEGQEFIGWDAELMMWFINQSKLFRWGSGAILLALLMLGTRRAIKSGHLVLRPARSLQDRGGLVAQG